MAEIELRVTEVRGLTPNIKLFEFVAVDGGELPPGISVHREYEARVRKPTAKNSSRSAKAED